MTRLGLTSVQFSSVTQSCPTLCNHMNCSTPGLPVHHQLPESTQTHFHWVSDAIQPSHPLSPVTPFSPCLQSFPASGYSAELALCIRWPKYWSFRIQWLNVAVYVTFSVNGRGVVLRSRPIQIMVPSPRSSDPALELESFATGNHNTVRDYTRVWIPGGWTHRGPS